MRHYLEVGTPVVYHTELWKTSGHYEHYASHMFALEADKQACALKPMNCPSHCLIFASAARSYRDLPMRLADFGVLHRNEFSGALVGLTRVRKFCQDDAHLFCREDQMADEIRQALLFMRHVYGWFGFKYEVCMADARFRGVVWANFHDRWFRSLAHTPACRLGCVVSFCSISTRPDPMTPLVWFRSVLLRLAPTLGLGCVVSFSIDSP